MPDPDLEARVTMLEAKEEIREFIASYCALNDTPDSVNLLVRLFAENAVMRNPAGTHDGREAIHSYYQTFFSSGVKFARHHVINQVITILGPGRAKHESYFIAFLGRDGQSKIAFGRYEDVVVKKDGVWRFEEKVNDIVAMTSLEAGWAEGFAISGNSAKAK